MSSFWIVAPRSSPVRAASRHRSLLALALAALIAGALVGLPLAPARAASSVTTAPGAATHVVTRAPEPAHAARAAVTATTPVEGPSQSTATTPTTAPTPVAPAAHAAVSTVLQPLHDAVSYAVDLTTTGDGHQWTGRDTLVIRNAGAHPINGFWLRLWGNGSYGCTAPAIVLSSPVGATLGNQLVHCTAQLLRLAAPLAPGGQITASFNVSITAPNRDDRFGHDGTTMLFGNALPVVAQRDRLGWHLPPYSFHGESFVSSWAHFDLTLHHPAALSVPASGTTTDTPSADGKTVTTHSAIDARDAFWAAGPLAETTLTTTRGTVVHAWSTVADAALRQRSARAAVTALEQIERHLPAYPYAEYDVVVATIEAGGGMEYPGAVITDGTSQVTHHETAHQWFYGWVGDDQYREPWIDEGLASFVEYTWTTTHPQPLPPDCYPAARLNVSNPTTFATNTMRYWDHHVGLYIFAYDNPVCALRHLRLQLGATKFDGAMRTLVRNYRYEILTGAELRQVFSNAAGYDLTAFWRSWALGPHSGT